MKASLGSETRIRSCGGAVVLVDDPAEQIPSTNVTRTDGDRIPHFGQGWGQAERAMRALPVVVLDIGPERPIEMRPTEDQRPVEALGPDRLDHALGVGIGVRRLDGRGRVSQAPLATSPRYASGRAGTSGGSSRASRDPLYRTVFDQGPAWWQAGLRAACPGPRHDALWGDGGQPSAKSSCRMLPDCSATQPVQSSGSTGPRRVGFP